MFTTRQSKYTFIAVDIAYLIFLFWHIITLISNKVTPLTTPRGSALVILVGIILLSLETFVEGTKSLKARMKDTMNVIQTIIIAVLLIYTLYLGFGVEVLSQTLRNISTGFLILLFVFLTKELLFDMKGN